MRHIGTLPDEQTARRFTDFLLTQGIESNIEANERDWSIWVYDEDAVARAREQLAEFLANPNADHYVAASQAAAELREDTIRKAVAARKNFVNVRERWRRPAGSTCPVTVFLMFVSMLVAFYTQFGKENEELMARLRIAPSEERIVFGRPPRPLEEVRDGEWWRLITPIFLHLSFLHILFNMLMLYQLGTIVEYREGSLKYLIFVLVTALVSNLAQYYFRGPAFGGMSGVVYGLFGYIWMKGKFDPRSNYGLDPSSVIIMMGFYFGCILGFFGPIANWAHSGGLAVGMITGITEGLRRR